MSQGKYDHIEVKDEDLVYVCPISQLIMSEPVSLSCGHSFEEIDIKRWLEKNKKCAFCSKDVDGIMTKNFTLKGVIESKFANQVKPSNNTEVQKVQKQFAKNIDHPEFQDNYPSEEEVDDQQNDN